MGWHHLKHRGTGEERIVAHLNGIAPKKWAATPLPREPHEHEDVIDGKLVINAERAARAASRARFHAMDMGELMERFEALEARVAALEARDRKEL